MVLLAGLPTWSIVLIVISVILIIACIALYFFGKNAEKKQAEQQKQMDAAAQTVSMLIIDKKRLKIIDAGLPQMVIDQVPKIMRRQKMPIVKAKVGPKIMTLICDEKIFDLVPVKKEVKATVSGIYITNVKGVRGPLEAPVTKKSFSQKMRAKLVSAQENLQKESATEKEASKKSKKK